MSSSRRLFRPTIDVTPAFEVDPPVNAAEPAQPGPPQPESPQPESPQPKPPSSPPPPPPPLHEVDWFPTYFYNHLTIVLHPLRNREVDENKRMDPRRKTYSQRFLRDRRHGFMFISWFKNNPKRIPFNQRGNEKAGAVAPPSKPPGSVGLFATVDFPQELIVIKRVLGHTQFSLKYSQDERTPPEAWFSTLPTLLEVDPYLFSNPPLFVQTNAIQCHRLNPQENSEFTLFQKYYNSGTLLEFVRTYKRHPKKPMIPEGFIWHVIGHLARALSHLHRGSFHDWAGFDKDVYELHVDDDDYPRNRSPGLKDGWDPIIHNNLTLNNIWLHYPSDGEKAHNIKLRVYNRARNQDGRVVRMPMVVIGDFGLAFQESKTKEHAVDSELSDDLLCHVAHPGMPERATWRDKALLGLVIHHLMLADQDDVEISQDVRQDFKNVDIRASDGRYNTFRYSERLRRVAAAFQPLIDLLKEGAAQGGFYNALKLTTNAQWDNWPTNDFVYGKMISQADYQCSWIHSTQNWNPPDATFVCKFTHNTQKGVYWARPAESFMPIRSRARWPPSTLTDWRMVWKCLDNIVQTEFQDHQYPAHAHYESRPVEIMKVWPRVFEEDLGGSELTLFKWEDFKRDIDEWKSLEDQPIKLTEEAARLAMEAAKAKMPPSRQPSPDYEPWSDSSID